VKSIKTILKNLFNTDKKRELQKLIASGDAQQLKSFLQKLEDDRKRHLEKEREDSATRAKLHLQHTRRDEIIKCADCGVPGGEYHHYGCYPGLCPNATAQVCISPMRLLRRDEIPPEWIIPEPPDRPNSLFVRLPSRCDECGILHPMFPGNL
jgi:hypothetical protein